MGFRGAIPRGSDHQSYLNPRRQSNQAVQNAKDPFSGKATSADLDNNRDDLLECGGTELSLSNPIRTMQLRLPFLLITCSIILILAPAQGANLAPALPGSVASVAAYHRALTRLEQMLEARSMKLGAPIYFRIFKRSGELEVWLRQSEGRFELFKTYIICRYSGNLGPKLKKGDKQGPEGFYTVRFDQMNPWSRNHLSFNLGYPNEYDQLHKRSGSALMVHGGCTSTGCYAMTDYYMDEIYTLADRALAGGQTEFQVHIFPFRLTQANLALYRSSRWYDFWLNLKQGYDLFEHYRLPPKVEVINQRYTFRHHYERSIAQIDP